MSRVYWPFGAAGFAKMTGAQIAAALPAQLSPQREQQILDLVRNGNYVLTWVPLTVTRGNLRATFWVSADALRLGTKDDSFRVAMTAYTQQKIADELHAVMPTALLSDEIYRQAHIKLIPRPQGSKQMSTMQRMLEHHAAVESQFLKRLPTLGFDPSTAIVAPVGKDWVNSRRLFGNPTKDGAPAAVNYGWQRTDMGAAPTNGPFPAATGYPPLVVNQSEGMAHNMHHQDYSQVARLVSRLVMVCHPAASPTSGFGAIGPVTMKPAPGACAPGQACVLPDGSPGVTTCMGIYELAQDPVLHVLLSHNGPVYMRHYAVPYEPPAGQHQSIWGGIQPSAPPPNTLVAPPAGEAPPEPMYLDDYGTSSAQAGLKLLVFAGSAALAWWALNKHKR